MGSMNPGRNHYRLRFTHNWIIESLEERLREAGFDVQRNLQFSVQLYQKTLYGEMDIYALNKNKRLILGAEVKSLWLPETSYTAYHQLIKDLFYLKEIHPNLNVILMYAYGNDSKKGYICQRCKQNEISSYLKEFQKETLKESKKIRG